MRSFRKNLASGLRLLAFRPVARGDFKPSLRQVACLSLLAVVAWAGVDYLTLEDAAVFSWFGAAELAWLALIFVCALLLMSPASLVGDSAARMFTALAAVSPGFILIALTLTILAEGTRIEHWVGYAVSVLAVAYIFRILRVIAERPLGSAMMTALVTVAITWGAFIATVSDQPQLWYAAGDSEDDSEQSGLTPEEILFRQPALIDAAVASLAPGRAGTTDVYFAGFAGDGTQQVFQKEVKFAHAAFARKYELAGRAIELLNAPRADPDTPRATGVGLRRALLGIGGKMKVDKDVLVLFLTSHGSKDAELSVRQSDLPLRDLSAADLASALAAAGIKWRVIVISACYSGAFIDALRDDYSFIFTAARADRTSFGCDDERELTYFGEALFKDALPVSASLEEAAQRARTLIATRERQARETPSEPQIFVGKKMRGKLGELAFPRS
jgi:hypothetical protein